MVILFMSQLANKALQIKCQTPNRTPLHHGFAVFFCFFLQLWYLKYPRRERWFDFSVIPLRFELLSSIMIPISLKVPFLLLCFCFSFLAQHAKSQYFRRTHNETLRTKASLVPTSSRRRSFF